MDAQAFHQRTAEELAALYTNRDQAPDGWRETLAWHWELAGAYGEAVDAALEVAEMRVSELAFTEALRWVERVLALLDRLSTLERRAYEMRAYSLTIMVLELGASIVKHSDMRGCCCVWRKNEAMLKPRVAVSSFLVACNVKSVA